MEIIHKIKNYISYILIKKIVGALVKNNKFFNLSEEIKYSGWVNQEEIDNIKIMANIAQILERYCDFSYYDLTRIYQISKGELMSPLRLSDDEFSNKTSLESSTLQNKRKTSIFKYSDDCFMDIYALKWKPKALYNIWSDENPVEYVSYLNGGYNGICWLYDEKNNLWIKATSTQKINTNRYYYGDKSFIIPCIEITDTKHGICHVCYIANKDSIPEEFNKWFIFTEAKNYTNCDEKILTQYIQKYDLKQLLYKPITPAKHIDDIDIGSYITITINSNGDYHKVMDKIIDYGYPENDIILFGTSDDNREFCIQIQIQNNKKTINIIDKIKKDFNYDE